MRYLACIILFLGLCSGSLAQSRTDAGIFIQAPTDARTIALGGNASALDAGAASIFINSAQAALSGRRFSLQYNISPWQPGLDTEDELWLHQLGLVCRIHPKHTLLAGCRYLKLDRIRLTDGDGTNRGEISPYALEAGLGYSFVLLKNLSFGINGRYLRLDRETEASEEYAADLSLFYNDRTAGSDYSYWKAGMQVSNIGRERLPLKVEYALGGGLSWSGCHRLGLTAGVTHQEVTSGWCNLAGCGAEYSFMDILVLRAGYRSGDESRGFYPYTAFGGGLRIAGIRLDASYTLASSDSPQKDGWNVSVAFGF